MKEKILKKLLAILMIMTILSADFLILGKNLVSYATSLDNVTNNENIEFSSYFKDEAGNKVESITESIKKEEIKMYAEIKVKNEGYFNGIIELEDSNFRIKNKILSDAITSIEGNKINLKQINAGSTIEVELEIEPIILENISIDMLIKPSIVKLTGEYIKAEYGLLNTKADSISIEASKTITANFQPDEDTKAELVTDIITNKVLSIKGTNKRVVQLLVRARLSENQYPIKQTTINVDIPQLSNKIPEEVKVVSLGTKSTNGEADKEITDFKNENGKIEITLKNEPNENNEITWNKNSYDQIIVTYIYNEDVDASKIEIETNSEIQIHNFDNKYTAKYTKGIENTELNNIITSQTTGINADDIYKGQLYANTKSEEKKEIDYKTNTKLTVTNIDIADKITIHEGPDAFGTETAELATNTKYIKTEINKEKMLSILGENGSIQIKNGETTYNLTKDSETNEDGNIVITYENALNEIEITTSKPENIGILELTHTKAITDNTYTMEQLKTVRTLKIKNNIVAKLGEEKVLENSTEKTIELKETITKAELTVSKENLSTITTNDNVIIGIKLITDGTKYDLYKNPTFKIQLPSAVEEISVNNSDKLYAEGFEIKRAVYNKKDKVIELELEGEQTVYPEAEATQLYLQLDLNITLSKYAPSKTDKIAMTYTNENATQYYGNEIMVLSEDIVPTGTVEQDIGISSPSGMVTANNIQSHNIEAISGINEDKQLANIDKNTAGGTEATFKIALINNTKAVANNVKILGNFPTDGQITNGAETITNTLATTLKGAINAQNCTIYYSSNINATADLNDTNNGWSQNLAQVSNPKSYLIEIASMEAETNFEATYTVTLPSSLDYDMTSYTKYKVIYNEVEEVESLLTGLTTGEGIKLETNISATVGNDTLNNGDTVKNGEVIKYKATVKNNGTQALTNIVLKGGVPEGTVVVVPEENYVYTGKSYYEEKPEITEFSEIIPSLAGGQEYTIEYEVRAKMDLANGTKISNKATVTCTTETLESSEITNIISDSKIRVSIKRAYDESIPLTTVTGIEYTAFIENTSNQPIKNLTIKILSNGTNLKLMKKEDISTETITDNTITIDEIPANDSVGFNLIGDINEDVSTIEISLNVIDSSGNLYRSNRITDMVEKIGAQVELSSPTAGEYVNIGDIIEYNITVKNTGTSMQSIMISDNIPEELEIQQIYLNDKLQTQSIVIEDPDTYIRSISNNFTYLVPLNAGAQAKLTIEAKVRETDEQFDVKTITNIAKAGIVGKEKSNSSEVIHIIKSNTNTDMKNIINGVVWLDENQDGKKDSGEKKLSDITVRLFDVSTQNIAKDKDGNIAETKTNDKGEYTFTKINNGQYIVLFEYDTTQYEPTTYMKEGVSESQNSKAILKTITINGEEKVCAVTDTLEVTQSIANINLGLKENLTYDLELNKYISRIVVQNQNGTKAYEYKDSTFQKVEIHRKQINNSIVILEYTIRVTNTGKIAGYITKIKDYLPSGLEFSSELNPDWYLSEENLHTNSLANTRIEPGESKEIKLILTKKMTENNTGLINNRAEIEEDYNEYGKLDIDSIANNQAKEDDLGAADVIIAISTGGRIFIYTILVIINTVLISVAIYLIFRKNKSIR